MPALALLAFLKAMMQETDHSPIGNDRAITTKSILFGLLGILFTAGLAGFHDGRITSNPPMIGMHMPVAAYFYFMLVALGWNLVCSRTLPALVLTPKELMVVMGLTLMGCFAPTSGLCRYFQRQLMLPWYYLSTGGKTEWEKLGILNYLPSRLFPEPAPFVKDGVLQLHDRVYRGFFMGLAYGKQTIGLTGVPWGAWVHPLLYWGPLVLFMSLCVMSLSLLVHRQWAHHEQLSYPVAQVATSFLARKSGKGVPDLFRTRLFWWGFAPVIVLYLLEYLHLWFPATVPGIQAIFPNLKSWSVPFASKLPVITKAPGWWSLNGQALYFSVVGLAYFVSTEISLTMGLSSILLTGVGIWFFMVTGTPLGGNDIATARGGAYIGYALILIYTGRAYYVATLKMALRFSRPAEASESVAVMAARLTFLSFAGFVAVLTLMGLDWLIALNYGLLLMLLFLVFTRIICETGIPFMQPGWFPGVLLVSVFGPAAVGPGPLVFVYYLGTILCQDPRECLMPYAATAIKIADDAKARISRIFWVLVGGMVAAMVIAFVATTWSMYDFGGISPADTWASQGVPKICFDDAARQIADLKENGRLDVSASLAGVAKLRLFSPDPAAMGYLVAGLGAVVAFSLLRFRFKWFPLHPVLFLVWGTYPAQGCWSSFLVGWAVKQLVVRFGGGRVYQNLKPLFVGLIAGELIAAGTSIAFEIVYYLVTGQPPNKGFSILPA